MADEPKFHKVQFVGRHVPDVSVETNETGDKYTVPLPGEYEIGVMFGKKFHALHLFQAGNVLNPDGSHVDPADKKSAPEEAETPPSEGE